MVILLLCLFTLVNTAPFLQNDASLTKDNFNFTNSYIQFFRVKDLIEHIDLKKFKKFHNVDNIEDKASVPEANDENIVTGIDLTDSAILNDKVTVNSVELEPIIISTEDETSSTIILEQKAIEQEDISTTVSVPVEVDNEKLPTTTLAFIDEEELNDGYEITVDEYDEINEIDTGDNKFFVSKHTAEAAQKYGYKILLKKVGSEEIPVGKIKFSLPTVVEIENVDDPFTEVKEEEKDVSTQKKTQNDISTISTIQSTQTPETTTVYKSVSVTDITTEEVGTTTEEPITEPTDVYLPPPITAIVPTVETIDEESIAEGVMKVKEETVSAIAEIMSSSSEDEDALVFPECSAPLEEGNSCHWRVPQGYY